LNRSASFARMVNPAKKTRKTETNNFFIRSKIRVNISISKLKQFQPTQYNQNAKKRLHIEANLSELHNYKYIKKYFTNLISHYNFPIF
jgi:hypothetical protein